MGTTSICTSVCPSVCPGEKSLSVPPSIKSYQTYYILIILYTYIYYSMYYIIYNYCVLSGPAPHTYLILIKYNFIYISMNIIKGKGDGQILYRHSYIYICPSPPSFTSIMSYLGVLSPPPSYIFDNNKI